MLEIWIGLAAALIVGVLAIVCYAATKPDAFKVTRSQNIAAPAERIYPLIANLRQMNT